MAGYSFFVRENDLTKLRKRINYTLVLITQTIINSEEMKMYII